MSWENEPMINVMIMHSSIFMVVMYRMHVFGNKASEIKLDWIRATQDERRTILLIYDTNFSGSSIFVTGQFFSPNLLFHRIMHVWFEWSLLPR
jgi:hypothetical protein